MYTSILCKNLKLTDYLFHIITIIRLCNLLHIENYGCRDMYTGSVSEIFLHNSFHFFSAVCQHFYMFPLYSSYLKNYEHIPPPCLPWPAILFLLFILLLIFVKLVCQLVFILYGPTA